MTYKVDLYSDCLVTRSELPRTALPDEFEAVWMLHPTKRALLWCTGVWRSLHDGVAHASGATNTRTTTAEVRELPAVLQPLLGRAREEVDERLNGVLVN